jgi:hypothetical protein
MKPSALRIERLLAKVEAELARSARPRRYCFYFDEEAEAKAQGLPCIPVPRPLSREEWEKECLGSRFRPSCSRLPTR